MELRQCCKRHILMCVTMCTMQQLLFDSWAEPVLALHACHIVILHVT